MAKNSDMKCADKVNRYVSIKTGICRLKWVHVDENWYMSDAYCFSQVTRRKGKLFSKTCQGTKKWEFGGNTGNS